MRVQKSMLASGTFEARSSAVRSATKACTLPASCIGWERRISTALGEKSQAYAVACKFASSSGRMAFPTPQPA